MTDKHLNPHKKDAPEETSTKPPKVDKAAQDKADLCQRACDFEAAAKDPSASLDRLKEVGAKLVTQAKLVAES